MVSHSNVDSGLRSEKKKAWGRFMTVIEKNLSCEDALNSFLNIKELEMLSHSCNTLYLKFSGRR